MVDCQNNPFWRGMDSFAEISDDLVILADRQGKIVYGNSQSEAWTGFKADELIGRDIKMLMPDRVAVAHDAMLQQFVKKADEAMATDPNRRPRVHVDETRNVEVKHKDGQVTPSSLYVSILKYVLRAKERHTRSFLDHLRFLFNFDSDPADYTLCAILRDCTKICELEKKKDSFMATVNHELRTPLNGVIGLSESLRMTEPNAGRKKHLDIINNCAVRLLALVNEIMDMAALKTKKMQLNFGMVQMNEICEHVCAEMVEAVDKRGRKIKKDKVELEFFPDPAAPEVEGDKDRQENLWPSSRVSILRIDTLFLSEMCNGKRLEYVMSALINNACKFTSKGSVKVMTKGKARGVLIKIVDTGIGIADQNVKRIFTEFEQEDDDHENRKYEGLGLGLSVSNEVINLHGGRLWCESEMGKGTTFFIDLVCNAREVVDARAKRRAQKKELAQKMAGHWLGGDHKLIDQVMADEGVAGEGDDEEDLQNTINELSVKEVLIIDDCDDTATLLRPMLVDRAYKTNTVADGFAALDYFNTHPMPDIVIMETELPGSLPGLDFLSQFRREKPPEVPVLVVTKSTDSASRVDAIRRGATAVYSKPVTEENLPIIVDHIFALIRNRYHVQHENKAKVNYEVMGRVMPKFIIDRLRGGATMIADKLESVSCVSAVVHQFELITQAVPVTQLVVLMNKMTNSFDQLSKDNGMYPVLSNGERFLAICGHESTNDEHTEVALRFANKLLKAEQLKIGSTGQTLKLKIGVNTGVAYAGVIGGRVKAPQYAFFGPGVQIAGWLAETGVPSHPHVGDETYKLIMREHEGSGLFSFQERGELRISDTETLQTWLFKERADQDLCHLKALGVMSVGGAMGDDSGDMLERIQELEAELSILHGTSITTSSAGVDGEGQQRKISSQADLIQEQLKRKGTISAKNAISLVEPMERICETLLEVVAFAEEEEDRANELLEEEAMAKGSGNGKQKRGSIKDAELPEMEEQARNPILVKLSDLEGQIKELNSQAAGANVEARRAHRVLRDLVKIGFHVGDQTDMVPSREKAEEMITSMEEVVNSIVMATGLAREIEAEQKRIAAEEAAKEAAAAAEAADGGGSDVDEEGGKKGEEDAEKVEEEVEADAMHPLIKTMRTLQKEIDFIQDYVADTEDLLEAVTGGTAANSGEPQGLFGLQIQQLQTAIMAKEEELARLEEQLNGRGEEAQMIVKLQKDLTDAEIRRGCLQGELEVAKMEVSRLKTKGFVLKKREQRSAGSTALALKTSKGDESADIEGLKRLLAAKQAEAEMYKSAVADRPLNNAAAVMKQQNDIIHQLNHEIIKLQNEAAAGARGGGTGTAGGASKGGHAALVASGRADKQVKDLQEALLNAQQDMKHLMLEMRYHQTKTSQLVSDNQMLAKDNQTMQTKLLEMASKMEAMQQTLRHREVELADPRHMIKQARDQVLLPGDKVSGLYQAGFGRQGYGMPPSLGLGQPTNIRALGNRPFDRDFRQSSLIVEELSSTTQGAFPRRPHPMSDRDRPKYSGYSELGGNNLNG
ncbi:hypothetical protein FOL47_008411 [Perkinsus chesapeaki]|uniref:histidine kinase n=1 Tax=Perkinsus chesapeaki TaxID=330153 RepID=A0A7J6LEF7_PERCH|nr:hypothetical protein FOL47_008411 [Perkinsus chesapeaki]